MRLLTVLLAVLALSGCDSADSTDPASALVGTWELVSFEGEDALRATTLRFDDDSRVYGTTPCNSFESGYRALSGSPAGNRFDIDTRAWTEAGCPPELAAYQERLDAALERVSTWGVDEAVLMLTHLDVTLSFRRPQ